MSTGSGGRAEAASDREIVTTRVFDAPRERMFDAFSDPDRLAGWWGPTGFTSTFHEFDLQPEGVWRFVMHGPDGTDYTNESVFIEVERAARIVLCHLKPMHRFLMTGLFGEEGGKTRLTWRMLFESTAECDRVRAFAGAANEQNFDRLEAQLAAMA
jgi:uncharacterized protein YndB with AHSA1/START domain